MSRKIAFTSLGCDKNRVDSEVMPVSYTHLTLPTKA